MSINKNEIIVDGEAYIKHEGLASDSYDNEGTQYTSILLLGNPLNLVGFVPIRVQILIPESAIHRRKID